MSGLSRGGATASNRNTCTQKRLIQNNTFRSGYAQAQPAVDLRHLLANAVRHSPNGASVTIRVRGASDGKLTIEVADTGAGIAPEDLAKIFDRFYKGAASTGSGLGLTIARSLVRAHGGEMTATSRVGEGTTVTVKL